MGLTGTNEHASTLASTCHSEDNPTDEGSRLPLTALMVVLFVCLLQYIVQALMLVHHGFGLSHGCHHAFLRSSEKEGVD